MITKNELLQLEQTLLRERKILQKEVLFFLHQTSLESHKILAERLEQLDKNCWIEILQKAYIEELHPIVKSLDKVEASLSQMEMGLYGLCADCERPIHQDILFRNPSHQRCDSCHQQYVENPDAL
mgnify:CR=1 FL=1